MAYIVLFCIFLGFFQRILNLNMLPCFLCFRLATCSFYVEDRLCRIFCEGANEREAKSSKGENPSEVPFG